MQKRHRNDGKGFKLPPKCLQTLQKMAAVPPSDTDFRYVAKLPKHLQRMAAFWEYARESKQIVNAARAFDAVALLPSKEQGQRILDEWEPVMELEELLLITTPFFPAFSFEQFRREGWLLSPLSNNRNFGMIYLFGAPLEDFVARLAKEKKSLSVIKHTQYMFVIPWEYTDERLVDQFRQALKFLRPRDRPQRKRPGRSGVGSEVAPIDMLNQLAALRLRREDLTFSEIKDVARHLPYVTAEGWNKAAESAKKRIASMDKVSFFQRLPGRSASK